MSDFNLEHSLHTHEAARLSGATKASAEKIRNAPKHLHPALMRKHKQLARMARDSWMASRETDHG